MSNAETPIQRLRRVAHDALDILRVTDDNEAARALEEALLDTRLGSREYECGCTLHHFVNDDGPHVHYCLVHAAAPRMLEALKVATDGLIRGRGWALDDADATFIHGVLKYVVAVRVEAEASMGRSETCPGRGSV